jgi:hypothetical protein
MKIRRKDISQYLKHTSVAYRLNLYHNSLAVIFLYFDVNGIARVV